MGSSFTAWPSDQHGSRPSIAYASEAVQLARSYDVLLAGKSSGSPYEYQLLFATDSLLARQRSRHRFKLLQAVDPTLGLMLDAGERVHLLTRGSLLTVPEHFFCEWAAYYLHLCALVFTTRRLLLIQIDLAGRPRGLVAQLPYAAIATVRSTWDGYCQLGLAGGRRYNLAYIPRLERKPLREMLATALAAVPADAAPGPGAIEPLCPRCFRVVPGEPPVCPHCQIAYRSWRSATLRSAILPGLGHRYLGHRGFGTFSLWAAAALWTGLVVVPLFRQRLLHAAPVGRHYWVVAGLVLAAAHVLSAVLTRCFARKGHYLETGTG